MKNYVQPGESIELTAPVGGVVSGTLYKIGHFVGVATTTAAAGAKFNLQIEGVVEVAKVAAEPWTEGLMVWFNSALGQASSVSTTSVQLGVVTAAAAPATTVGKIKLNYGTLQNQG